ncbi:hypothetical protein [Flexilinea flocculi]|jgi:hypothetical protein|uniref:hypothetical protein n=1 Tax=Flexilinea flocculi TaxID=1678840 RepID=UPI0012B5FDE3|nr:hypothetical protein [Flexilinea flocculi]
MDHEPEIITPIRLSISDPIFEENDLNGKPIVRIVECLMLDGQAAAGNPDQV